MEKPYLSMPELAELFGLTTKSLHNSLHHSRFPVPTYKMGKFRVADKAVVKAYFDAQRQKGLAAVAGAVF